MLQRENETSLDLRTYGGKVLRPLICLSTDMFKFNTRKTQEGNVLENIVWEFLRCCAATSLFDFYSHCIIV